MRYVVLLFGLLGLAGAGFLIYSWAGDWDIHVSQRFQNLSILGNDTGLFFVRQRTMVFLVSGVVLSLLGIIFSVFGQRGFSGGILLIAAGVGPGVLFPYAFVFTGSLIVAGVCSLFVRPPSEPAAE